MSKFYSRSKLSKESEQELLLDFCDIISSIKDPNEAAKFLRDLLSPQEIEMLAKRIKVAELLIDKWSYNKIKEYLKVGESTIARVNEWLKLTGDGYRLVIERLKKHRKERIVNVKRNIGDFEKLKRRFPIYFWPELLSKDIIRELKIKNKDRIFEELEKIKDKPELYKDIQKEFEKQFKRYKK
jgi:TrpR-related protein YerC/YecD